MSLEPIEPAPMPLHYMMRCTECGEQVSVTVFRGKQTPEKCPRCYPPKDKAA